MAGVEVTCPNLPNLVVLGISAKANIRQKNKQGLCECSGEVLRCPEAQADSGFFTGPACISHCGGELSTWAGKLIERTQLWLP